MPSYNHRRSALKRRRDRRNRMILIGGIAVAAVLIVILIVALRKPKSDVPAMTTLEASAAPSPTVSISPSPSPTSAPTPTPAPVVSDAARAANRPSAKDNLLPIFRHADTEEKIIAITVDDCFQASNLRTIVDTAIECNAKLTIFPIGEVALREKQTEILKYAWENGMELENHTFTHNGLYGATDDELAREIYYQNLALSKILGVEYQCHFLRPKGGDARADERMHAYCRQMGYMGIAHWTMSGSGSSEKKLAETLAPGNIYLFHTTDKNDFEKLCGFIRYATNQGYQLVTLNEMFGYPENETLELEIPIEQHVMPTLAPYESVAIPLEKGDYDYRVLKLQQDLKDLGLLATTPDGVYGDNTAKAVKKFQEKAGLKQTGKADMETLKALEQQ